MLKVSLSAELQPGFLGPSKEFKIEGDVDFMLILVVKTKFTHFLLLGHSLLDCVKVLLTTAWSLFLVWFAKKSY